MRAEIDNSGGSSCSITCVYAAPIVVSNSSTPLAWAIQSGMPPREDQSVLTGTTRFSWWVGAREAYQAAMDEVIVHQLPRRFKHCAGQEPVAGSMHWWSKCSARGFVNCRGALLAGSCCCPVGFRIRGGVCEPCGGLADSVTSLHRLPMLYTLRSDSGKLAFRLMVALSFALLPLPWAWCAQLLWNAAVVRKCRSLQHYTIHHERKIVATAWRTRRRPQEEESAVRVKARLQILSSSLQVPP